MANKSKAKGNAFEYDFADKLTDLLGRNFKRNTSGSGAMFGGGNFTRKLKGRDTSQVLHDLGDIVPPTGYYVVSECKSYAEFDFHKLLGGSGIKTYLWDWLEEVRHDARLDEKTEATHLPHWLAFKVTRRGAFIALPDKYFGHIFDDDCDLDHQVYNHRKNLDKKNPVVTLTFIEKYYIIGLADLEPIKESIRDVISDSKYFADDVTTLVS